jgi:hypothetical protein
MSRHALLPLAVCLAGFLMLLSSMPRPARGDDKDKAKHAASNVPKDLTPRLFTLEGKDILLTKAMAELAQQTGNPPVEVRHESKEPIKLKLQLKNATFWQALDAIAKEADLKLYFDQNGKLALVDGPYQVQPISYSGLFRVTISRMDLIHLLEEDQHVCNVYLNVAWEPRFQPLGLETRPDTLTVVDDKKRSIDVPAEGERGKAAVGKRPSKEIMLRLPAPQRTAQKFAVLKGQLGAVGPSQVLTFTFDKLAKIKKEAEARKETQNGVTVTLRELSPQGQGDDQVWAARLLLEYPADGPKFESFQSWLVNNEIYLEKEKEGIKQRFPPNLGYETDDQSEDKAIICYRFGDEPDRNLVVGKISDWKLIYRTPGRIAEMAIPFEFKDVKLP